MRSALLRALLTIGFLCGAFCIPLLCRADGTAPANQAAAPQSVEQAKALVHQALQAEAQGKADQRQTLLKQAEQIAPDFAPAHWQSGDVQRDGKWVSFDAPPSAPDPQRAAKLEAYRQRRDQARNTYEDQIDLARWCEKAGLKDQQRAHLLVALKLQPRSVEAQKKLGLVYHRGTLMPLSQIDASDAQFKQQQEDNLKWKDRLVSLRKLLDNKDTAQQALRELRSIDDPTAIPALEAVFGRIKPEAGRAIVEALSKMHDQSATESLVRFAVFSPSDEVRYAAAKALKDRSMYAYVPLLIAGLDTPYSVGFNKFQLANGAMGYQMMITKESPTRDKVYTSTGIVDPTWYPSGLARLSAQVNAANPTARNANMIVANPAAAMNDLSRAEASAESRADQALQANDDITATNERIVDVLSTTTGQDLNNDPVAWFNWWTDYNEYTLPDKEPTEYRFDSSYGSPLAPTYAVASPRPPGTSCFTAGTPVQTADGLKQIEKIKPGDFVLAQNPETGELAYKPVLGTTAGPPISLINLRVGDAVLRCSRGHPFWVSGSGWKMAKELRPGDRLHTVHGPVLLDSVENEKDPAVCYNLVVADFDTFFVGKTQLLVHDLNLRQPTEAVVPGLIQP